MLHIELDEDTERRLRNISRKDGGEIEEVASRLLAQAARSARPAHEIAEAELLQKINEGWSAERWGIYQSLVAKRRAETLTEAEYAQLAALTNEREVAHARRIQYLVELAKLRGTTLDAVMDALGVRPPGYV